MTASIRKGPELPVVQSQVEHPAWEHSLYLTLFITTSGGW
jgi:hypothetical protein